MKLYILSFLILGLFGTVLTTTPNNNANAVGYFAVATSTPTQDEGQSQTDKILEFMEIDLDCEPSCWTFNPHESTMSDVYKWFLTKFSAYDSQNDNSIPHNFVGVNISGFELVAFSSELEGEIYLDSMYLSFPRKVDLVNDLTIFPDNFFTDELSPTRISIAYTDYASSNIRDSYYLLVEFSDPNFAVLYWGDMTPDDDKESICISQSLESILWFVFPETNESAYLLLRSYADYENSQSLTFPLDDLPDQFTEFHKDTAIETVLRYFSDDDCVELDKLRVESNE